MKFLNIMYIEIALGSRSLDKETGSKKNASYCLFLHSAIPSFFSSCYSSFHSIVFQVTAEKTAYCSLFDSL